MATKKENLEDPNSCWSKAADDEPIFILRGHDHFAPEVIRYWTALMMMHYCIEAVPDVSQSLYPPAAILACDKITAARIVANQMELWLDRKIPD